MFVRMYGPKEQLTDNFMYNARAIAEHNIEHIVEAMPASKLDWALQQVTRSVKKDEG